MARNAAQRKTSVSPDEITFGVEIECQLPRDYVHQMHIVVGHYHHGIQLPVPYPNGWNAQSDCSVNGSYGFEPLEIVSPVLRGAEGLQEVLRVFELLNQAGVKVDRSCGFHVHIGARSVLGGRVADNTLVVRWVRRMLHLMSQHEGALFAITGRASRMDNAYCATIKDKWAGVLETTSDLGLIQRLVDGHSQRYYTLNLQNLFTRRQTVEFRLFGATTDGIQAIGYIVTAMGIAHRAAECGTAPKFDAQVGDRANGAYAERVVAMRKALAVYGWPTGAKERWGKAIRAVQLERAARFGVDRE